MLSERVNLVTADACSPSLEENGDQVWPETALTPQACHAVLPSESCHCQPRNRGLDASKKPIWTARSMQNKARLSAGGQMDTEQV